MLVGDIMSTNAKRYPDKIAIIDGETKLTYKDLNNKINKVANGLLKYGVTRGSRVGIIDKNSIDYVAVYYAVAKIGAIIVPINTWLRSHEISEVINQVDLSILFIGEELIKKVDEINSLNQVSGIKHYISFAKNPPNYMINYEQLLQQGHNNEPEAEVWENDPHEIIFTSGTTGKPKGAFRNHKSFILEAKAIAKTFAVTHEDIMLMYLPMFHIGGGNVPKMIYLVGGTVVILPHFNSKEVLKTIEKYSVTWSIFVPATIRLLLDDPDFKKYNLSSLITIDIGGSPVPKPLLQDINKLLPNSNVFNGYGMTECTWVSVLDSSDSIRKMGSIGKPVIGVEIGIKDDNGNFLAPGKQGEIVVRSNTIMQGYWKDEERTKSTIQEGWLHTGDIGLQDQEGYFYIVDRKKDIIISGGENVSSLEVENILLTHPLISEVAVIGIPDPVYTEKVVAVVRLKEEVEEEVTDKEIIDFSRPKLAGFKNPKKVFFVKDFPRTAMSKISKKELRDMYSKSI